jgi:HlyD family secretion protein
MNRRRILIPTVAVILVVAGFLVIRGNRSAAAAASADVQTAAVERGSVELTVSAAGVLESPQAASLSWQTGGIVDTVSVKVGDQVHAGQVLMELDPTSLDSSVIQASSDLAEAQRALDDLLNSNLARAEAQKAVADAQDALDKAQRTYHVQQQGNRATSDMLKAAQAKVVVAREAMQDAKDEYDRSHGSTSQDAGKANAYLRYIAAQKVYNQALASYNWYTGHPSDIEQAGLDADVAIAQAQLEDAQRNLARMQNGPDPLEVEAAQAKVAQAQATVNRARIVAPFDATVVSLAVRDGDTVESGQAAVGLADLRTLQVQVDVSEVDINQIQVGQEARLTLDAAPDQTYPGVVSQITLAGVSSQGVVTFPVTVELADPDPALKPGMSAAVGIVIDHHDNVLLVPNRALRLEGSQRSVVVLFEGQQISVPVTLGLSNESVSEVAQGSLREGDEVVVTATTSSSTSARFGGGFIGGAFRP